jgi:CheY-like chemotaxis protein
LSSAWLEILVQTVRVGTRRTNTRIAPAAACLAFIVPWASGRSRSSCADAAAPLVLIVDDVEDSCEVYEEFLATLRLRVVTASDGQDALAKAFALQPSIVLDLGLPVIFFKNVAILGGSCSRRRSARASSRRPFRRRFRQTPSDLDEVGNSRKVVLVVGVGPTLCRF